MLHRAHTLLVAHRLPIISIPLQGGHVALHGAHFSHVRRAETSLTPARALILRLKRSRLERQRRAVDDLLAIFDDFMKARGMLSNAFTPTSHLCASGAHLLRTMGGHALGKNTSERVALDLERVRQALTRVDLAPFERRRKRHRVSVVVAPALLDAVADVIASDGRGLNHENAVGGHAQSESSLASVAAQKHAQVLVGPFPRRASIYFVSRSHFLLVSHRSGLSRQAISRRRS